ncbi:MAG: P-loop NTPase fold protein [Kofleriaceae bacterium]
MWPDNETGRDFVNFTGVASTVAEIIAKAQGQPISIGVSGAWGVGKSSMIHLIKDQLSKKEKKDTPNQFVFVEFNAWLYQGYDDARAALMEVIARTLADEANKRKTAIDKTTNLLKRVNWFRVLKLGVGTAVPLMLGLPPVGLLAELYSFGTKAADGTASTNDVTQAGKNASELVDAGKELLKERPETSPPKEIQALREAFEEALRELDVTLVVLIDDLDRCLPATTISTLEAIRLFLFMNKAAFVIAADTEMIKHAVRKHFEGISDDNMVTSYFDKLIQIPLRVPPLGTQEVRAYMMLLFAEQALNVGQRDKLREAICRQLSQSWQGKRVDQAFVREVLGKIPDALLPKLEMAERLASIMTKATAIAGNPRLIKRFLNALSIRMSIAQANGVDVDETVLAKLLLFERIGDSKAYLALLRAVTDDSQGKAGFLSAWEAEAHAGKFKHDPPWDAPFVSEWLTLKPSLGDVDLRGALYVGREHAPLISAEDNLSLEGAELLKGLIASPRASASVSERLKKLPQSELSIIMDRLLERARREDEWGSPPILEACIVVASIDPSYGSRLANMLKERPVHQVKPNIVPKISSQPWAIDVFVHWQASGVSEPVKKAIQARKV